MTPKLSILLGALANAIAVGLGAFGAHALKSKLEANGYLKTYETAVQYHFIHAMALILLGILMMRFPNVIQLNIAGWLFVAGLVLFSGSLYTLSISEIKVLGAITPFGGLAFIAGWILFAIALWKQQL